MPSSSSEAQPSATGSVLAELALAELALAPALSSERAAARRTRSMSHEPQRELEPQTIVKLYVRAVKYLQLL